MTNSLTPEEIKALNDIQDAICKKLGFPKLTAMHQPVVAPIKLASYSKISKCVNEDGSTKWMYCERPLVTPTSPAKKRCQIVIGKVIDVLKAKKISSRFADEIVRILSNKHKGKTTKRGNYRCCNLIPPEFQYISDDGRRKGQRIILGWILSAHFLDPSIFNLDSEQEKRLFNLKAAEDRYVEEQRQLKAYIEKTKAEYDAIENGDLQASDYDAIDAHIQQMADEMENH